MSTSTGLASVNALGDGRPGPKLDKEAVGIVTLSGALVLTDQYRSKLLLDPGGATRVVTLPAGVPGRSFELTNSADGPENLTVNIPAGTLLVSIRPGGTASIWYDGDSDAWVLASLDPGMPRRAVQTIDMADAQVKLVYGTAGAGEVQVTAEVLAVDANSGATEDLLLPTEATSAGRMFFLLNTGGEDIVVKEDSDTTTICTISTAESAVVFCSGMTWFGGVLKAT
jgi:hypothetical protein